MHGRGTTVAVTRTLWGALLVLLTAGLAGLPAVPGHPATSPVQASARPNVVVVMADDMRTDDLRFMPAVRRLLVRPGLNFRNSFSPDPLCCPARASFLTGLYAHTHGVTSNGEEPGWYEQMGLRHDQITYPMLLQKAGYQTVLTVHDEGVFEIDKGFGSLEEGVSLMTTPLKWAKGLPVKAEGWRGKRYRK